MANIDNVARQALQPHSTAAAVATKLTSLIQDERGFKSNGDIVARERTQQKYFAPCFTQTGFGVVAPQTFCCAALLIAAR